MQATKFQVKLYASGSEVDLDKLIPVFHEWIREKKIDDELLIDVADYAHVPQGPGVVLIGHQSDYYLDMADDRPGLLYSRKRGIDGDLPAKVNDAFRRALLVCDLLEKEDPLGLKFGTGEALFRVQDRLAAPNDQATFDAFMPLLESTAKTIFGGDVTIERVGTERDPFSVKITTTGDSGISEALARS